MSRTPLDQVTSMPNGTQQSPIDIVTKEAIAVQWPATYFSVDYAKGGKVHGKIDGHNFVVDHLPPLLTHFGGKKYRLAKIHFHDHCGQGKAKAKVPATKSREDGCFGKAGFAEVAL